MESGDCDDDNIGLNPRDLDGDGFSTCEYDCDDMDPALSPQDFDSDGYSSCTDDCDDFNPKNTLIFSFELFFSITVFPI